MVERPDATGDRTVAPPAKRPRAARGAFARRAFEGDITEACEATIGWEQGGEAKARRLRWGRVCASAGHAAAICRG